MGARIEGWVENPKTLSNRGLEWRALMTEPRKLMSLKMSTQTRFRFRMAAQVCSESLFLTKFHFERNKWAEIGLQ